MLAEIATEKLVEELKKRQLIDVSTGELFDELKKRVSEDWNSSENIESKTKGVSVNALINNQLPKSPPIEVVVGGKKYRCCFRELSRDKIQKAEQFATGYIVKCNSDAGLPYEHINSIEVQERLTSEKELRLIFLFCVEPIGGLAKPAFPSLEFLRATITGKEQNEIMQQWYRWVTVDSWKLEDALEENTFKELVESVKKNDISFWINLESTIAVNFIRTLVSQL